MFYFFFFNDTATTEIYTLSLHDALPICTQHQRFRRAEDQVDISRSKRILLGRTRSEEHTSELQSQSNLVCRLLLEKKKNMSCSKAIHSTPSDTCGHSPTNLLLLCIIADN